MKAIRFEIEGLFNSYKVPIFKTYHKTYLAPPKTMLIGMLCNILGKSEKYFYETLQNKIDISIIIDDIKGTVKDLWCYKTLSNGNRGKSIVRRERNFLSKYTLYLKIEDTELYSKVFNALCIPNKIPSLGQDDEIINIKNIIKLDLEESISNILHSTFESTEKINFRQKSVDLSKLILPPTINKIVTKFTNPYNAKTDKNKKRTYRKVLEEKYIVEYLNGGVEIISGKIDVFKDSEKSTFISFY